MAYELAVKRDFIARHFLIGGDWGAENSPHAHHYVLGLTLRGERLNAHGYLVDIVAVEAVLDDWVARFRDSMLNEMPEFEGLNPSIEHFCRIAWHGIIPHLNDDTIESAAVTIWENEIASASYSAAVDRR